MAKMIPDTPKEFALASLEGVMFAALQRLPDEYFVFHSFRIIDVRDGIIHESETDFVIFSKEKGLLCLEAKAGQVSYRDGRWYYGNGVEMSHGGPFIQAANNEYKIRRLLSNRGLTREVCSCKTLHAVWFPSVVRSALSGIDFPPDADKQLVLTADDLEDPLPAIERLFGFLPNSRQENDLTDTQANRILNEVLCPAFDLFASSALGAELERSAMMRMLEEQVKVLDFLEEQPCVAVNGAAGTGKTMVAVEKATRCAMAGEKVLFLCFNYYLWLHLSSTYAHDMIDFFTIDGLTSKMLGDSARVDKLPDALMNSYLSDEFGYQHVIVDEGQDFGQSRFDEADVLRTLSEIALDQNGGTFYVFYDRMQLVQGDKIPECIREAECRIVLRRNCRNTKNIAVTSMKSLRSDAAPLMREPCVIGTLPSMIVADCNETQLSAIDESIAALREDGYDDIVVLSCRTLERSVAIGRVDDGFYCWTGGRTPITTCRKFKGLEADAVVLIDVDKDLLVKGNEMLFYVGASRAKHRLSIIANMSEDDCLEVLKQFGRSSARRPKKTLAACLNAILMH